jgi:hypothetical protein
MKTNKTVQHYIGYMLSDIIKDIRKNSLRVPTCCYCDTEESLFKHQGSYVCSSCLESWDKLKFNHLTKRYRKVR